MNYNETSPGNEARIAIRELLYGSGLSQNERIATASFALALVTLGEVKPDARRVFLEVMTEQVLARISSAEARAHEEGEA